MRSKVKKLSLPLLCHVTNIPHVLAALATAAADQLTIGVQRDVLDSCTPAALTELELGTYWGYGASALLVLGVETNNQLPIMDTPTLTPSIEQAIFEHFANPTPTRSSSGSDRTLNTPVGAYPSKAHQLLGILGIFSVYLHKYVPRYYMNRIRLRRRRLNLH
ncbi:hypothetical protein F4810DRAFT_710570 [Camillea tinctor]|nr:hypothetical protein F4810DRAFT_710570 [Camillea tinctor]